MNLKIRYFGQLQEATGKEEEQLSETFDTLASLKAFLIERYPKLGSLHFKIAQNNKIEEDTSRLNGTLIDLLPPFSGG
jgi:molybdopterin converting factor small subunit